MSIRPESRTQIAVMTEVIPTCAPKRFRFDASVARTEAFDATLAVAEVASTSASWFIWKTASVKQPKPDRANVQLHPVSSTGASQAWATTRSHRAAKHWLVARVGVRDPSR
jgi:hypothetical protein